jgi:hypothetical protein
MSEVINAFPGYEYKRLEDGKFHNMYRGTDLGFGGYVYSEPGMYSNVALLDAASLHPTSIVLLNKLGDYTKRYAELREARVLIKHGEFDKVGELFDGKFKKYLENKDEADALSKALKLPLNAFFGISFASFDNPARDSRDKNNIIALRGALFMRTLQDEIVKRGFKVCHIKTDSVKVVDATPEIIEFVKEFGLKYGYEMEHECTYERICLVNDSTYIARYDDHGIRNKGGKHPNEWTATAKQFQVPYVFKTLFSREPIIFDDVCETMSVKTALYLRDPEGGEPSFIGKVGQFCPIKPGCGGKELVRLCKDADGNDKFSAATGSKGYLWLESEAVKALGKEDDIDTSYYDVLVEKAKEAISKFGDFDNFVDVSKPFFTADPNFRQCPIYKEKMGTPDPDFPDCKSDYCWNCQYRHVPETEPWQEPDICERGYDIHDLIPF